MTSMGMNAVDTAREWLSDPALVAMARRGDEVGVQELVERHGLAMTRFEATVGMAVTDRPDARVEQLIADDRLPLRAAWLADRATDVVRDADDAFLLDRFTELTLAWRTALWHAEVEGDSPTAIARLLGMEPDQAVLTVRTARNRMLWSVVAETPTGGSQECLDMAARLCGAGADVREVLSVASEHGRTCDDCMLLVKRALLFGSSLRESLLRSVAGELAVAYSAARPPAFRPRARGDLAGTLVRRARPAVVTLAMGGAAAVAVTALAMAPGTLAPYLTPDREVAASVVQGELILPVEDAAEEVVVTPVAATSRTPFFPVDDPTAGPAPETEDTSPGGRSEDTQGGSVDEPGDSGPVVDTPTDGGSSPSPETPTAPTPTTPPAEGPSDDKSGGDKPATGGSTSPVPPVTVGPITVDVGGDGPLVSVDGPVPVEIPALPELGDEVTEIVGGTGSIVTGLLG